MAYGNKKVTFERPDDIRIVDMCIFVDNNFPIFVQRPTQELEDKLVKYLYWIIDSLAKKYKYFPRYSDYDDFALFAASEAFLVIRNKLVKQGQVVRGREVVPIKSCLNYIKNVLYAWKVQYQQNNYGFITYGDMIEDTEQLQQNMRDEIKQQYLPNYADSIKDVLSRLPKLVYYHLRKNTPYKNDEKMIKRIYISCMLTLVENITLRSGVSERLSSEESKSEKQKLFNAYSKNTQNIILWHLPSHMENYIRLQVYKIKRIISNELWKDRNPVDLSDEVLDGIMKTAFNTYDQDQEEV